jgi:hypothetical protein
MTRGNRGVGQQDNSMTAEFNSVPGGLVLCIMQRALL